MKNMLLTAVLSAVSFGLMGCGQQAVPTSALGGVPNVNGSLDHLADQGRLTAQSRCRALVVEYFAPGELVPLDSVEAYLGDHPGYWYGPTADGGNAVYRCR